MWYVSQIFSGFGNTPIDYCFCDVYESLGYSFSNKHLSEIVISSESGGNTERLKLRDVMRHDILGVGSRKGSGLVSACCHTKKTVQFHKYVHPVESGSPDIDRRYTIGFQGSSIACFGYLGGVVEYRSKFNSQSIFLPLYDAFVALCRSTGKNLLESDMIIFENLSSHLSSLPKSTIYIKVSQTEEARRFYTKMMLDVVGKYRRDLTLRF